MLGMKDGPEWVCLEQVCDFNAALLAIEVGNLSELFTTDIDVMTDGSSKCTKFLSILSMNIESI